MAPPAASARPLLRQLHIYLSFFIAPCLIFFAVTGAFQTFRIPDEKTAPVLLQKLARVHRDDVFAVKPAPPPKAASEEPAKKEAPRKAKPKPALATTLVKWFFVLTAMIMVITTLMGVWMGIAYSRNRTVLWLLLLAGAAVPASLLAL
jgi:hypothetical protein